MDNVHRIPCRRLLHLTAAAAVAAVVAVVTTPALTLRAETPGGAGDPVPDAKWTDAQRTEALRHATVWRQPRTPLARAALDQSTDGLPADLSCQFKVTRLGGTASKFDCTLPDGRTVRVKYGTGPERLAEVAATRLLSALGFGADRVSLVERLRCYGCPPFPFVTTKAANIVGAEPLLQRAIDMEDHTEFSWVSVEERLAGTSIESDTLEGWRWSELPRGGGAGEPPRAHVDALRLLAVFLAHWDNKAENQRLVCLSKNDRAGACARPFAYIQDLGATFGPQKVDLAGWEKAPIWSNRETCEIGMESLPWSGGTFEPVRISDAGRRFLTDRLTALTDAQVAALFRGARFDERRALLSGPWPIEEWVRVFKARVQAIATGSECPEG